MARRNLSCFILSAPAFILYPSVLASPPPLLGARKLYEQAARSKHPPDGGSCGAPPRSHLAGLLLDGMPNRCVPPAPSPPTEIIRPSEVIRQATFGPVPLPYLRWTQQPRRAPAGSVPPLEGGCPLPAGSQRTNVTKRRTGWHRAKPKDTAQPV